MSLLKTAVGVTAGLVTLKIVKSTMEENNMTREVNVKGHLRKVKGKRTKVRVKGHRMKSPKKR